jgi:hypothetical protein
MRKEGFSRSEPSLLAVQGIAAVRCNWRLIWGSVFAFFSCTYCDGSYYFG